MRAVLWGRVFTTTLMNRVFTLWSRRQGETVLKRSEGRGDRVGRIGGYRVAVLVDLRPVVGIGIPHPDLPGKGAGYGGRQLPIDPDEDLVELRHV